MASRKSKRTEGKEISKSGKEIVGDGIDPIV